MEELSMYFCLKLRERHKEYNKENTPIKFVEFLRLLQYPKKDINAIFNTMNAHSRKYR